MLNVYGLALLIPFAGTLLGAACVFFLNGKMPARVESSLLGFASGVMIAAGVFSLLLPGLETGSILSAGAGFLAGMFLLLVLDELVPHMHVMSEEEEGLPVRLKKTTKLFLAMTIHNIPEGMAVGVAFASVQDGAGLSLASALALALGIALQNLPEGAVLSMPLHAQGMSRWKAFVMGSLSGVAELLAVAVTLFFAPLLQPILPWLLSLAAGAMFYVTVEELIPECQSQGHSNAGTVCFALGFVLMMVLDVVLG